jgi:CRP-like cAMP-binding protein
MSPQLKIENGALRRLTWDILSKSRRLCYKRLYQAGDPFITYGVPLNRLFVMKTGKADVILKTGAVAAVAGPGTTLGEMEFVDGQPASANVVVSIDAEIVEFDPASLRDLLQNQPSIGYRVMGNMARKISSQFRGQQ